MMSFSPVESLIFPIDVVKMFEGMMDFSLSVHSVHLSYMNTVSVLNKP